MRLTTRKLVLRQIAHARGLKARAQEDPTYVMPDIWETVCFDIRSYSFNSKKAVRMQLYLRMVSKYSKNNAANIKFTAEAAN